MKRSLGLVLLLVAGGLALAQTPSNVVTIPMLSSSKLKFFTDSDCANESCTMEGQACFQGTSIYCCDQVGGTFELCGSAGGGGPAFGTIGTAVADTGGDTLSITDSGTIDFTTTNDPEDLTAAVVANSIGPTQVDETAAYSWSGANAFAANVTASFDGTMSTPSAPTAAAGPGTGGVCTSANTYRHYVAFTNVSGTTLLSSYVEFTPSSGSTNQITVTRPSIPSNANQWQSWFSSSADAHATIRGCGSLGAIQNVAAGTTTANCQCRTNQDPVEPASNTTRVVTALGITQSVSSSTYARPELAVKEVCTVGCEYTTVTAALTAITDASATKRYVVYIRAPYQSITETINAKSYVSFVGEDRQTVLLSGIRLNNVTDVSIENLWTTSILATGNAAGDGYVYVHNAIVGPARTNPLNIDVIYTNGFTGYTFDISDSETYSEATSIYCNGDNTFRLSNNYYRLQNLSNPQGCWRVDLADGCTVIDYGSTCEITNIADTSTFSQALLVDGGAGSGPTLVRLLNPTIRITETSGTETNRTGCYRLATAGATNSSVEVVNGDCSITTTSASMPLYGLAVDADADHATWNVRIKGGRMTGSGGASWTDVIQDETASGFVAQLDGVEHTGVYSGSGAVLATDTRIAAFSKRLTLPNSTAPPAADCDEAVEAGRIYMDTNATTGQQIYGCEGVIGWVLQGDGGGGGGGDSIRVETGDNTGAFVAATDPDFDDAGDVDFTLDTGATPDTIIGTIRPAAVSSAELDEAGVEAGLEAVIDLPDLQGTLTTGKGGTGQTTFTGTRVVFMCSATQMCDDAGLVYDAAGDDLTVAGTVTAGDFATAGSTAGTVVLLEDSPGANKVTLQSQASRSTDIVVNFPDEAVTDIAVLEDTTQTLTDKTIDGGDSAAGTTRPAGSNILGVRTHNTDCTSLTDGKQGEVCVDEDDGASWTCIPTAGDCSGAEWKRRDDTGAGGGDPVLIAGNTVADASGVDLVAGTGVAVTFNGGVSPDTGTFAFDYTDAGTDPALNAEECRFSNEGASAGGWVCEGATANTIETRFRVTDPTSADRTVTIPDADSTTVQPDAGAANNFLTAISSSGVVSKAQPAFTNISGTAADGQVDGSLEADEVNPTLGTQTQGNYVEAVSAGTGLTVGGSAGEGWTATPAFYYGDTLAGNPAYNAEECTFTTDGTGSGGFICEGTTAGNTNEQLYLFPASDGADTTNYICLADSSGNALAGDTATAFFTAGQIERARGGTNADTSAYGAGLFGSDGSNNTIDVDTEAELETALGALDVVTVSTDDISSANLATLVNDETGSGSVCFATSPVFSTSIAIPQAASPTVDAAGEIAIDTTDVPATGGRDQLVVYDGAAAVTIPLTRTVCATIENLAAADDNYIFWTAPYPVTAVSAYCIYQGTASTAATIDFQDGENNAMTMTDITCADGDSATRPTFQAITAANTLVAGESIQWTVTNAVSPETMKHTICVNYTSQQQ